MNKIIRINNEEYIKKKEYDKVKKLKVKNVKEEIPFSKLFLHNLVNTMAICPNNLDLIKRKFKFATDLKEYNLKPEFLNPYGESEYPRVKLRNTYYNYEYFIKAENLAKFFDIDNEYSIYLTEQENQPCILRYLNFAIIIAPIVLNEK
jgi:hypothetical protein